MYYIYGVFVPSLLIESTDSMISTAPLLAVASVSADQTEYWVNEQEDLWITLHLDGQKGEGRECVVSVMTVDGTATGEHFRKSIY